MSALASQPDRDGGRGSTQTVRTLLSLREAILKGELAAGERITELALVGRFGVSRTPVRAALARLEEEGFLEGIPSGGYVVKTFQEKDIFEAIEIRGVLEGLAARRAAERRPAPGELGALRACLEQIDVMAGSPTLTVDDFSDYVRLNARFHELMVALADSRLLAREIERVCALPFASPGGLVMVQALRPESRDMVIVAQDQHRCLFEAIAGGEGARADDIAREHSRLAIRNLHNALADERSLRLVPGAALLARNASATNDPGNRADRIPNNA